MDKMKELCRAAGYDRVCPEALEIVMKFRPFMNDEYAASFDEVMDGFRRLLEPVGGYDHG